jgi:hypothetical protein
MIRLTRSRVLFVAIALPLVTVAGCGGGSGTRSDAPVPKVALPVDPAAELASPADRYALIRAQQELAARCMRARGLRARVSTSEDLGTSARWDQLEEVYRYGLPIDAVATDFGLTRSASTARAAGDDPNGELLATMTESEAKAWMAAMYGTGEERVEYTDPRDGAGYSASADGCQTQALVRLYGSFGDSMRLSTYSRTLRELVQKRAEADPRYLDVEERWARCAKDHGLDYDHPVEAVGAVRGILGSGPSRRAQVIEERGVRMVVACERATHIYELGWKLAKGALPGVLAEEAGNIADYRAVVARAREVLAEGG